MTDLEMTFDSSNACLRSFYRIFCSWGQRKTPYDVNHQIKGQTAPLWANPSPKWFLTFFILNFICSLLFVASFIVVQYYTSQNNSACITEAKTYFKTEFIVIGSVILFVNCKSYLILIPIALYWLFIYLKDYATDQEWSRYLIILIVFDLALLGFIIADFVITAQNLSYYNDTLLPKYTNDKDCQTIFKSNIGLNFAVSVFCSIISVMMVVKSIFIAKEFFLMKHVPHTAICEDEDIIIME